MFYSFLNDIIVEQWFFSHYMDEKRIYYYRADLVLQIPIMYYRNDAPKRWWFGGKFCFETFSKNINFFFVKWLWNLFFFFKKAHLALRQNNLTARSVSTRWTFKWELKCQLRGRRMEWGKQFLSLENLRRRRKKMEILFSFVYVCVNI